MRKPFVILALAAAALLTGLLQFVTNTAPKPTATETSAKTTPASAPAPAVAETQPTPPHEHPPAPATPRQISSPLAAELNSPAFDARHDVATLHGLLRQYFRILHGRTGSPIGNDSDLARVLTGHNPMRLAILPRTHPALSPDGRLRDRWGTPYFIHPRGQLAFEIRSAGPDRKLFSDDDLVENPASARTDLNDLPTLEDPSEP